MTTALVFDGMTVPVERAGRSRRAHLTVERDGSLRLRAAHDVQTEELTAFLKSKREWIYTKLAEKERLRADPVAKQLVDGEGFLYLGRSHQLRIVENDQAAVRLERGRLILPSRLRATGYDLIIDWYQSRGIKWLRPQVSEWATRLRVDPSRLDVADLGHKWGSATSVGWVRIHWATLQLRPGLVDYVLAHELAHLHEPHHGPSFWARLGRVMPDYEDRRAQLALVGPTLWFGAQTTSPETPAHPRSGCQKKLVNEGPERARRTGG
ncbi:M48 family metallopeptidase [Curtobacterium sp. NPDC092190]|uniref:M48 family metallopeptidase n=1 Tax=Curtobacterium sp. NPDC092190 TaxID=3363973 RepID=UPI00381FBF18